MRPCLTILSIFFIACSNNASHVSNTEIILNSRDTTIKLKDSLGHITISIPTRYDTSIVWTHFTDFSGGDIEKYRFQPKALPIKKESGWMWDNPGDSVDQLTIQHYHHLRIADTSESALKIGHLKYLSQAKIDVQMNKLKFDTVELINNKLFSIIASENYDTLKKVYGKQIWASTFVRGNILRMEFKMFTQKNDSITQNFINNSVKLLATFQVNSQ